MAEVIGALRVVLGADTAALDKGLKDAQGSLASFARDMAAIAAGIKFEKILTSAFDSIAHSIKLGIEEADKLGKMSQSIGIPVEELSKLKYAAELSDVSLGTLSTSMGQLNKNMVAVAGGGGRQAAAAFKAMGIEVKNTDGSLKTSSQVLAEVADKFAGYEDGAAKSALAVAIFGRSGAAMIPLLNEGSAGLKKAADEAERFGIVISKDMADSAQTFNDNLTKLHAQTNGLFIQLSAALAPALEELSNRLVAAAGDGNVMRSVAETLIKFFGWWAQEIAEVTIRIGNLGNEWAALQNLLKADIFTSGAVTEAWKAFVAAGDQADEKVKQMRQSFTDFFSAISSKSDPMQKISDDILRQSNELGRLFTAWQKTQAPIMASGKALAATEQQMDKATAAMMRFFDAGNKTIGSLTAEANTIGMTVGEQAAYKYAIEGVIAAKKVGLDQDPVTIANIQKQAVEIGNLTQQLEDSRQAWNFFNQEGDKAAGLFADVALGSKSASDAFKEFAQSVIRDVIQMIAKMIILNTVIKPLFGAFGGGFGGFFGFSEGGSLSFASGGSFTVPGGSSYRDNQTIPINVASGERVRVDRPGSGGSDVPTVTVNMAPGRYTREEVRQIFDVGNQLFADGYKLKMAS